VDTSILIIVTAILFLSLAGIVMAALFKGYRLLRIAATAILVAGIILRELTLGPYVRGLPEYSSGEAINSEVYREGMVSIVTYCYQTSIYVIAISLLLVVLSMARVREVSQGKCSDSD
jgi:hypothetical protein